MSWSAGILTLHSALWLSLLAVAVALLRFLQKVELLAPPLGARRVHFGVSFGDPFPTDVLPADLAAEVTRGAAIFLYASPTCCICGPVVENLRYLAADYRDIRFVVFAGEAWNGFPTDRAGRIRILQSKELLTRLKLTMEPYALKVVEGKVVDYGIVNSIEHVESLIDSRGAELPSGEEV
jgi:hypothetical protein